MKQSSWAKIRRALAIVVLACIAVFVAWQWVGMASTGSFAHPDLDRDPPVEGVGRQVCEAVNSAVSERLGWDPGEIDPVALDGLPLERCRIYGTYEGASISVSIDLIGDTGNIDHTCTDTTEGDDSNWMIVSGLLVCTPYDLDQPGGATAYVDSRHMALAVRLFVDEGANLDIADLAAVTLTALIEAVREAE